MNMPTDYEIARAQRLGRATAQAGHGAESCPYAADGAPHDRVLAARWVAAYLTAAPSSGAVDYSGD